MNYHNHDATISVWDDRTPEKRFRVLLARLLKAGYTVTLDPRIEKGYPSLSRWHRRISRQTPAGLFEVDAEWFPAGMRFEAYQNVVTKNPAGGRYDFDRLEKMPFLIRMRWLHFRRFVFEFLNGLGLTKSPDDSDIRTPLDRFNRAWTPERFKRGPDGWPDESELKSWPYLTADKVKPTQGMVAYAVHWGTRRWVRGRIYGGINGMWLMYDEAGNLLANHNAGYYRASPPPDVRRRQPKDSGGIHRAFKAAMERKDYERVARIAKAASVHGLDLGSAG